MKKVYVVLILLGTFVSQIIAQSESTMIFLRINPSSRNAAMGDAGVALDDDVYSIFFNPAGLARQYDPKDENTFPAEITFSYAKWLPQFNFDDLYYLFWAGRYYMDGVGMLGASIQYMNYGDIIQTGSNPGEVLGTFSSNETSVTLAYALPVSDNLDFGAGAKIIYSNLANVQVESQTEKGVTTAFGLDLGLLYRKNILNYNTQFGVSISNMGPNVSYVDEKQADPMPMVLRAGFAVDVLKNEFHSVMLTYQFDRELTYREGAEADEFPKGIFTTWKQNDNFELFTHSIGAEYWYTNLIAFRAGYFYESPKAGNRKFLSVGMGLKYLNFKFDLSYLSANETVPLGETIRLSVSGMF